MDVNQGTCPVFTYFVYALHHLHLLHLYSVECIIDMTISSMKSGKILLDYIRLEISRF